MFCICSALTRSLWRDRKLCAKPSSCCSNVDRCRHPRKFTSRSRRKASHWPTTRASCSSANIIPATRSPTSASTPTTTAGAFKSPTRRFRSATSTSSLSWRRKRLRRRTISATCSARWKRDSQRRRSSRSRRKFCSTTPRDNSTPPHKSKPGI